MNINAVMTTPIRTCAPTDTLATAARLMGEGAFGFLPVIGARDQLVGVITDRDVCLAVAHDTRAPLNIPVLDAMTRKVFSCRDVDDAHVALAAMKEHRVRRLPVLDGAGRVMGVVSIDDLILHALEPQVGLSSEELTAALKHLCAPRPDFAVA